MQIYLVGGAVRDKLLNFPIFDKDWVVVGATAQEMIDLGYQQVGQDFPVFIHPKSGEEYALARTERKSGKGYTGFQYHADPSVTLEEDLLRRDLTINAMAMDVDNEDDEGQIYDPYNGQQDLADKLLRHVSPAFSEDPLRVLRVARFAARYHHLGFLIADETLQLMTELSTGDELEHLTSERVWKEFERALSEPSPWIFLQVLQECNAITKVLPELAASINDSLIAAFQAVSQQTTKGKSENAITRFACLLSLSNNLDTNAFCERLRTPNLYKELTLHCKNNHQRFSQFDQLSAEEKLNTILALDLIRRPQRLPQLIECVNALHTNVSMSHLNPILDLIAEIQPKQLMAEGFKGPELGEAINQRRLSICEQFSED
jgi:tRNA nucleotidyltransferase (CCA-adding enzyme)